MNRRRRSTGLKRLIVVALIGAIAGLWTWTAPGRADVLSRDADGVQAYLLDNGFHTDLALPRAALETRGGPLGKAVRALPPGEWVLIGWGDAKFYVDQSPISDRLPDGARAFFAPGNSSVVMLDPSQQDPSRLYGDKGRAAFRLSPAGFARLADRIQGSLDLSTGAPRLAAQRPGDDARFFASRETFSILHLCNHWTAEALNAAGLSVRPLRSITSSEVMAAVRRSQLNGPQLDKAERED